MTSLQFTVALHVMFDSFTVQEVLLCELPNAKILAFLVWVSIDLKLPTIVLCLSTSIYILCNLDAIID